MTMSPKIPSFPLFVLVWNQLQNQTTPDVHLRISRWLARSVETGKSSLLLMAFRGCGKSTLVALLCAWLLLRDPNVRILVVSAEQALAVRMVRNVRKILERHPLTAALKPARPEQWAADRLSVTRTREGRDPSLLARGLSGNLTGARADVIICDDVEVPNTADTADKRAELRDRLHEINYIRVPGGLTLYVGTPHALDTIYVTGARDDLPEGCSPFLAGYTALRIPVLTAAGESIWPERFSAEDIEDLRRRTGAAKFDSQMMLTPRAPTAARLDPAFLLPYDAELTWVPELQQLYLGEVRVVSASAFWDPAFGREGGDSSVLAVVFGDADGHLWVQEVAYLRVNPADPDDEATQQCRAVAQSLKTLRVPAVAVEINGLGRFLPALLRREIVRVRAGAAVVEVSSRVAKSTRILEALEAPMAARMLHIHRRVLATKLIEEMREWTPGDPRARDDGLDALAGAVAMEPVRIAPGHGGAGRPAWRSNFLTKG